MGVGRRISNLCLCITSSSSSSYGVMLHSAPVEGCGIVFILLCAYQHIVVVSDSGIDITPGHDRWVTSVIVLISEIECRIVSCSESVIVIMSHKCQLRNCLCRLYVA